MTYAYALFWIASLIFAIAIGVRDRVLSRAYFKFLVEPWKLASFVLATGFFIVAAPYTGDPTWDRFDGGMMATLTYLTAPWSIGAIFRAVKKKTRARHAFVAIVCWLVSASWCYDAYLWWRDGQYPRSWLGNLAASTVLYACAGLFWNVAYEKDRGVVFAFMRDDWFARSEARWKTFAVAAIFGLIVVLMMVPFFLR